MVYNASDKKQIAKARKKSELNDALKFDVIKDVMSSAAGRKWIFGLLESAHIFHTSFVQGLPDRSTFNEGERNHGLMMLADIQSAAPESYLHMIREAKENLT